jgi:ABC-3C protein
VTHEASASVLGYLYQVHTALLELLRRNRQSPGIALTIEKLDDVAFEDGGSPVELLQTKHHVRRLASLSDASPDLWRTIGVWLDAITDGSIDPQTVTLTLLTTAEAPAGAAAASLRATDRDPDAATISLERTARTSTSASHRTIYERFLRLTPETRRALVRAILVLDGAAQVSDLESMLRSELRRAAEPRLVAALSERLLGWWYGRVIHHLTEPSAVPIYGEEVELQIDDLRDKFASDNLPIDVLEDEGVELLDTDDRTFVRQLQLIAANDRLLELAIRDYKRAYQQKSRWVRDGLVFGDELDQYERRLIDEWEHHEAFVHQRSASAEAEGDLQRAGMELYETLQKSPTWIRPRVEQPFVVRGSLHKLADELRVGWHPDFVARLRDLLEEPA